MYKCTVEDNSPGTETSNAPLYSMEVKHKCTTSSAIGRSNPGDNNLKPVVVVHY